MIGREERCRWLRREYDFMYFRTREEAVMRVLSVALDVLERLASRHMDIDSLEDVAYAKLLLQYARECLEG